MNRTATLTIPFLLCVVTLLAGTTTRDAAARTWVASPDGSSGDGTVIEILPQMQDADSLRLLTGEHEWLFPHFAVAMTLLGDDGARVVGEGVYFQNVSFVEIVGVEFYGLGGMSLWTTEYITLRDCVYRSSMDHMTVSSPRTTILDSFVIDNANDSEHHRPAGMVIPNGDVRIERCVFAKNRCRAGRRWDELETGGGGLMIDSNAGNVVVRECVFEDNEAVSGSAMHCKAMNLIFEQNTIVGNRCESGAVVAYARQRDSSTIIRQNIFSGNAAFGLWTESWNGYATVYCNAFWENNLVARIGDFNEREDHQWRSPAALGYEGESDYHSTHADPMLCDSLVVHKESLLATQDPPCAPIGGARGFGCVVHPVRETSWGALKDMLGR